MAEREIIWVVTNCNSTAEAVKIGKALLKARLVACFDIFSRVKTMYFWPPKTGKVEGGKGAMLVLVTLPKCFKEIEKVIKRLHSDDVPFVGAIEVENVSKEYYDWLKGELK
jgi:periplasmic divalent cation tolerance protein